MRVIKRAIPLLPLRGIQVFPHMVVHLDVGRPKSIAAMEEAMVQDKQILLAAQKDPRIDEPQSAEIYQVGTVAEIKQLLKIPGGTMRVLVEGLARGRILSTSKTDPFYLVDCEQYEDLGSRSDDAKIEALTRGVISRFEQYVKLSKKVEVETVFSIVSVEDPGRLADLIGAHLNLKQDDKQKLLSAVELSERLQILYDFLNRELDILDIEHKIGIRVRKQMEKSQKEYYLREQLKAIQAELGERAEDVDEIQGLRERIVEAKLPAEVDVKANREADRLVKMPSMSAEAAVVRTYLEWLLALPWNHFTQDRLDLDQAEKILNEDHYGLRKVKERILEYLAVRKLAEEIKGPILCLVGPPGVGKTSLAKSVARAIGRKFVRISLGGVRDEAEIRGHRRTYVGALPGRIIQGMRQVGATNPVFLMDEIDKMSSDFRGDPSSALLEVLDPEQNNSFSDHYIELPFDLSHVMFITTANTTHSIPDPLLDRMEVITIPGYTEEEKLQIGRRFLLPKQIKEHGLKSDQLKLSDNTIKGIIREYTREAGVRNLERSIATLCRKSAREIVQGKDGGKVNITSRNLNGYLGAPLYRFGTAQKKDELGVANGLAWTRVGGDVLNIEVNVMAGKGNLTLTGQLGSIMRESAQTGYTYVRSRAQDLGIEMDFNEKHDVHIHVPEGAIPKDGPSAGVTMATALASTLSGKPVRADVAMTGEITLRGRILPVGGIKEKVLAAHRAGIKTLILPEDNRRDLDDIPRHVRRSLNFVFVNDMDQVLQEALVS